MKGNRLWVLGTVASVVAIVLVGWLLGISPKLAEAAAAVSERLTVESMNSVQAAEIETLRDQQENFDELEGEVEKARASIPSEALTEDFVDAVAAAAAAAGVKLSGVILAEPGPWGVASTAEGAPVAESTEGAGSPPIPTAAEGVYTVAVTITMEGEPQGFFTAARQLQKGNRLFVISSLNFDANENMTGTIVGYLFLVLDPDSPAPSEGEVVDPAPAPTETPAPSESPTPSPTPSP